MRSAPLVALLLAACATPSGAEVAVCDATWREVGSIIVAAGADSESEAVPLDCMRRVDERRVRIGFRMPAGPDCHRLAALEVVEGSDAVSITVLVSRVDDPVTGPCPQQGMRTATELDLQAPVGDRLLLDGSRSSG